MKLSHFLATLLVSIAVSGMANAGSQTQTNMVDVQLRWHHQFQFAGYYAAVEKGFYREEGLDVRLHPGDPSHQPVEEVLSGHAQYAEGNSEVLYQRLRGKPLVALAAIFQHSPSVLLTRKDSGIGSAHDLIGKKVMLMNMTEDADFLTMLLNEGVSLSQLQIMPSSYNINDLISGKVDAFNSYLTNEPYYLKQHHVEFNVIDPGNYRVDFYSDVLFTSEAELQDNPKRVEAMRRATLRGWRYAMDHPDEIIDLLVNKYHVDKSRDHLAFEAAEMRKLILPDLVEIGHMNPGRWQHMANTFVRAGLAPANYSLDGFLYDDTPRRVPAWVIKTLVAVLILLAGITAVALYLHKLNRNLTNARNRLKDSEEQLRMVLEGAELGYWDWHIPTGRVDRNERWAQMLGYTHEEIKHTTQQWESFVHPDDLSKAWLSIKKVVEGRASMHKMEYRMLCKDGSTRWILDQAKVLQRDLDGSPIRMSGTHTDITDRKLAELEYKTIIETSHDGFLLVSVKDGRILETNHSYSAMIGYPQETLLSMTIPDIEANEKPEEIKKHIQALIEGKAERFETRHQHKNGTLLDVEVSAKFIDAREGILVVFVRDITNRKLLEHELKQQAHFDFLTNVSNRRSFMEQAELELARAVRYNNPLSVLMLDIDYFKQTNDTHGHKIGDMVLMQLTEVSRQCLREIDIIGRIGGEEFAILLPETGSEESQEVAERLRMALESTRIQLENVLTLRFTVSIGLTSLTANSDSVDVLLHLADKALYAAKNSGRNKVCVSSSDPGFENSGVTHPAGMP